MLVYDVNQHAFCLDDSFKYAMESNSLYRFA